MNVVSMEDVNYLAQQSSGRINMILSGMTALMNDTDNKVATMESQSWFQRMVKTVTGKNKLTQAEIQQNHDKLNAYMSEAIAELYNRNCIDHQVMMSLGTQLNELYADHLQLKQMLGAFVGKLNEKIDSVDNFHMLTTEIEQGVYSSNTSIVSICKVMSQFDNRILEDNRKLDIIKRSLNVQGILNNEEVLLTDYLLHVMEIPVEEMGQIYLELGTIRGNFMANIVLGIMEFYHFLPDMARKMKNKKAIIEEVIRNEGLDDSISLSITEIYDDFINSKIDVKNGLIPIAEVQVDSKLEEAEQLFFECKLDDAFELFKTLAEKGNARAMYFMGEFYAYGYGHVVECDEEAKMWRQKGSELGDTLSLLNVAYSMNEDSAESQEIFDKIFDSVLQLAESGDVYAQNELVDLYKYGYGCKKDVDKYYLWLKKSADFGYWRSMDELADYYNNKDQDEEAIKWYRKAADLGCASALNSLGLYYDNGYGTEKDKNEAFCFYMKAAEGGNMEAMYNVAYCYHRGSGISKDLEQAKVWYKKAFVKGDIESATYVGKLEKDAGNHKEAAQWFRKAAEKGDAEAQTKLGLCYDEGEGVEKDEREAFSWFMKAAEQGDSEAQTEVGLCYYYGTGVGLDEDVAKEWFTKAAEQGYEDAKDYLEEYYSNEISIDDSDCSTSGSGTINYDSIKTACELFVMLHDGSTYDASYKLKDTLGVLYEEVYLAHDDTLFKTGKNGFAITEGGIYCRELMSSYTNHISFKELSEASNIYYSNSYIYADGETIAYISGASDGEKQELVELFEQIAMYVRVDLM